MRVISGKNRGTKLEAPKGLNTRPTTDRIKETLFNIINFDLTQCYFLDLFSGSGQIGIEALSRGAKFTTFVEHDDNSFKILNKNILKTRLNLSSKIYKMDINKALDNIKTEHIKYDVVFLDPPYYYKEIENIIHTVLDNNILSTKGKIIIENAADTKDIIDVRLSLIKQKIYKTTKLNIYERIESSK